MGTALEEVELARQLNATISAERPRRLELLARSREDRRAAQMIRERSLALRDRALEHRWALWQVGLAEAPSFVPLAWESQERDPEELQTLLAAAAVRCEDVADRAARALETADPVDVNGLRVVAALCLVTSERILELSDSTPVALAACARSLERFRREYDPGFDSTGLAPALSSAVRATRRALLRYLDDPAE